MAYLRKAKETYEIDFSLERVWAAIPKALLSLKWKSQEKDDESHRMTAKTDSGFMLFSSILLIEAKSTGKSSTMVTVTAETPVTTITSMAEFGRARKRVDVFFEALAAQLLTKRQKQKNGTKGKA